MGIWYCSAWPILGAHYAEIILRSLGLSNVLAWPVVKGQRVVILNCRGVDLDWEEFFIYYFFYSERVKHWNSLPREVMEVMDTIPLETFTVRLDGATIHLSNPMAGIWTRWSLKVSSKPKYFMILCSGLMKNTFFKIPVEVSTTISE